MTKQEKIARMLAEWRGVDPDAPIIIVLPEPVVDPETNALITQREYDPAWQGYAGLADDLLAIANA